MEIHTLFNKLSKHMRWDAIPFFTLNAAIMTIFFNHYGIGYIFAQNDNPGIESVLFNISAIALVFATVLVICIPFLILNIPKIGVFTLLYLSASARYFYVHYGVVVDRTVTVSFFETSTSEVLQYVNSSFILWNLFFLLLMATFTFLVKVYTGSLSNRLLSSLKILTVCGGIVLLSAMFFYKDYASFFRNHREIRHMINPMSPVYEIIRHLKVKALPEDTRFIAIGKNAKVADFPTSKKRIVVFVLGETARSDHFALNGYTRETNPNLLKKNVTSFGNMVSCGTATAVSVPCIFSDLGREKFDSDTYKYRGNLLDVISTSGYNVYWGDNNSGCQGVCERVKNIDLTKFVSSEICKGTTCYDEILVEALKDLTSKDENQFVVLHMLGSHGPSYHLRYPKEFKQFNPSCDTSELSNCTKEQVINTYDNTILYTDHVLGKLIDHLVSIQNRYDSALLYVSDHGESLGENGIYLHSLPYLLAPKEQKLVPSIFWFSEKYDLNQKLVGFYQKKFKACDFSHDNIFSTTLGILKIKAEEYKPELDILNIKNHFCDDGIAIR